MGVRSTRVDNFFDLRTPGLFLFAADDWSSSAMVLGLGVENSLCMRCMPILFP